MQSRGDRTVLEAAEKAAGLSASHTPGSPGSFCELVQGIRRIIGAPLVVNRGFGTVTDREDAAALVADGVAEAVGVGRPALANPDLVERWRTGAPENTPIQETIYDGGAKGYTDYPALQG